MRIAAIGLRLRAENGLRAAALPETRTRPMLTARPVSFACPP
jgi:hypothetical protein